MDAADPHLAERLETETWRVVEWLSKRFKALATPEAAGAELVMSRAPLKKADVAAVVLEGPFGGARGDR